MKRSIFNMILGENLPLKDKVFRVSFIIGAVVAVVLAFERIIINASIYSSLLLVLLLLSVIIGLFLTFKVKNTMVATCFFGFMLDIVILPLTYVFCGGIHSGSAIWMIVGIAYLFVFFKGRLLAVLVSATFLIDSFVILLERFYPDMIISIKHENDAFFDLIFTLVLVGCTVGAVMKFQGKVYDEERKITETQKEELELVNEAKMRFFSSMSNELRTPINHMIELNEILLREDISDEAYQDALKIQNAGKILLSYVDDIMDCAMLEGDKVILETYQYDTQEMITEVVNVISKEAGARELDFVVKIDNNFPKKLQGDGKRIKQIIMNLLTNSLKTTSSGTVTLEIAGEKIGSEWVNMHIQVSDTGNGIRKEELEYVFDSYKKVSENNNITMDGAGIGLTICKQLVDLMDGKITVDSIYTKGTTYTVIVEQRIADTDEIGFINTANRSRDTAKAIYHHSFEAPEARILVVDDNDMNLMIFEKLLRFTKVQVDKASSGSECLKYTYNKYYNAIFLDYMMPEMNGVETLVHIRKQENGMCKETPVIALTNEVIAGGEKAYNELGFTSFLQKPIMGMALENKVLQYLPEDVVEYRRELLALDNKVIQGNLKVKKKVMITSDSVCDISQELANTIGVKIFYLYIKTSYGRFKDTLELASDNLSVFGDESLYDTVLDSASVEEYEEFFAEALTEAEEIIHISLGDNAGKSYNNCKIAAKGFDHVHVIDSKQISCGQGLLVLYASKLTKLGKSTYEIIQDVNHIKEHISAGFVTNHVENLYRKGYASETTKTLFSILNLRPVIKLPHGAPRVSGFYTGDLESAYKKFVRSQFRYKKNIDSSILFLSYVGVSSKVLNEVIGEIKKEMKFEKIIVCMAAASNTCGAGIGTLGFSYFEK